MPGFVHLLRWQFMRQRRLVAMNALLQVLIGVAVVFGFSFLVPKVTEQVGVYLVTGAATLALVMTGVVMVPQELARERSTGRQDYMAALPVHRLAPMLASLTYWTLVQLPGMAVTVLVAVLRFHISLDPSVVLIPAVVLTALTGAALGTALSLSFPPQATLQLTQFLAAAVLLFSPITYPIWRLPGAVQDLHRGLPLVYMADLMRGGLSGDYGVSRLLAFGVVVAWCVFGLAVATRATVRRS